MEKAPVVAFIALILFGSLCIFTGYGLLDLTNVDPNRNKWIHVVFPLAFILAGVLMALAAWRMLRFAALGTAMIFGGMSYMWAAPSISPSVLKILSTVLDFFSSRASHESEKFTVGLVIEEMNKTLKGNDFFSSDVVVIGGGLGLTAIGAIYTYHIRKQPVVTLELEEEYDEEGNLRRRRTVTTVPLSELPKHYVEKVFRK